MAWGQLPLDADDRRAVPADTGSCCRLAVEVIVRTELAAGVEKPGLGLETVLEILLDLSQRHP